VRTKPAQSDADRLNALARIVLRPRPVSHKILLVLLGLAIAGGGRWLFDQGAYGVPFLTFYPVVVLAALFLGAGYAIFASAGALLVIHFLLNTGSWNQAEGPVRVAMLVVLSITLGVMIATGHFMRLVLFDNLRHLRQARAYNAELQHRAKNAQQMLRVKVVGVSLQDISIYPFRFKQLAALVQSNSILYVVCSERGRTKTLRYGLLLKSFLHVWCMPGRTL